MNRLNIKNVYNYIAPKYHQKRIKDLKLVNLINKIRPDFVLNNIGGGTQEILGLYLKDRIKVKTTIICTGAALSFFTGDQAPILKIIDKFYLGWLTRIIFKPQLFLLRYIKSFKLFFIVKNSKISLVNKSN